MPLIRVHPAALMVGLALPGAPIFAVSAAA